MLKTKFFNILRIWTRIPLVENLLSKLTQGKPTKNFISKIPLNYTEYKHPSERKVTRGGIKYELDISDCMEWTVYFGIETEPRKQLYDLIREGDYIFDVGTNIGEVAMQLAKRTGMNGKVYAFEPDPEIYQRLSCNLSLNEFKNLKAHQLGFGNKNETVFMSPEVQNNSGGNRIVATQKGSVGVAIQKLDDFVQNNDIKKLDLLKIDVEGYEINVLKGATNTIEKFRPRLFVEVSDRNLKQQGGSARELLERLAYFYTTLSRAEDGTKINMGSNFEGCFFDVIATYEG